MTAPFSTIIADPPWNFADSLPGPKRGAASHYSTLSAEGLCDLRLPPIARDALLFFWRVASMPEEALAIIRAWGFEPKSELVWVKTTTQCGPELGGYVERQRPGKKPVAGLPDATVAFGMGRTARMCHETCIIATRGKTSGLVHRHDIRSVFFAPVGAHSAKPSAFYDIVEAMTEGPILELFARRERGGRFVCIGDELGSKLRVGDGELFRRVAG